MTIHSLAHNCFLWLRPELSVCNIVFVSKRASESVQTTSESWLSSLGNLEEFLFSISFLKNELIELDYIKIHIFNLKRYWIETLDQKHWFHNINFIRNRSHGKMNIKFIKYEWISSFKKENLRKIWRKKSCVLKCRFCWPCGQTEHSIVDEGIGRNRSKKSTGHRILRV